MTSSIAPSCVITFPLRNAGSLCPYRFESGFLQQRVCEPPVPQLPPWGDEVSAAVSEGEIAVASTEQLHSAPLSGRGLLALWNARPGIEKRKKVGDRDALIDQLWAAIEASPEPEPQADAKRRRSRRR